MDSGKVLIVNLSTGKLGDAPTYLLGAFIATASGQAAESRADVIEGERRDFTLYADEFQNFATTSFASILSEARKYHLALVLAHQFLGQLPELLRQVVFGNAGSIVAYRLGAEDAALVAAELGIENAHALTYTGNLLGCSLRDAYDMHPLAKALAGIHELAAGLVDAAGSIRSIGLTLR